MKGATGNIYTGLHEFNEMGFLLHFLRKDDVFADIGANVGSYTILASGVCRAGTVAIEPGTTAFLQLKKNIALNGIEDLVDVYNIAAGASKRKLLFTNSYDTVNHILADDEKENEENVIETGMVPLDEIFKERKVPCLVKIDVEGFETEVVNGMSELLISNDLKAIIIELNGTGWRYGYDEKKIHESLLSQGFRPYQYDPFKRVCSAISEHGNFNTIYIRDFEFVNERVHSADKVSVFSESF